LPLPVARTILFALFAAIYPVFVMRTTFHHNGVLVGTLFDDALILRRDVSNFHTGLRARLESPRESAGRGPYQPSLERPS
jgi:hypothetical protein